MSLLVDFLPERLRRLLRTRVAWLLVLALAVAGCSAPPVASAASGVAVGSSGGGNGTVATAAFPSRDACDVFNTAQITAIMGTSVWHHRRFITNGSPTCQVTASGGKLLLVTIARATAGALAGYQAAASTKKLDHAGHVVTASHGLIDDTLLQGGKFVVSAEAPQRLSGTPFPVAAAAMFKALERVYNTWA